ncbi:MAG: hypothetical protein FVQ83_16945 [Chloroflexi bacterium]|nr:hypothetical protein [Chloroflexota bacterium]
MNFAKGRVLEIHQETGQKRGAIIVCPPESIPAAGQYLQATRRDDIEFVFPRSLFPSKVGKDNQGVDLAEFKVAPPIPPSWQPGSVLNLSKPLGQGFNIPALVKKLGLVALGDSPARLLPLVEDAFVQQCEIAIFCDTPLPALPSEVEANPLSFLPEALTWADFLAIDIPLENLPNLRGYLALDLDSKLSCPAQALVCAQMPCAAVAECGVCAVPAKRGYKLACKHGPVFDIEELRY